MDILQMGRRRRPLITKFGCSLAKLESNGKTFGAQTENQALAWERAGGNRFFDFFITFF